MVTKEFLSAIPIFRSLPENDYTPLVNLWKPRRLKEGDVLFRKGDSGSSMFIVEDGSIEITVPLKIPANEMRVSVLHEGDFFGELSLFSEAPRTATVKALVDCRLVEMERKEFMAFVADRPQVSISMLGEIGKRLLISNELIASLASKNANVEIAEQLSVGDRVADKIAEFGGSWTFIISFFMFLFLWIFLNTAQMWYRPFDEYPFIFLNLMLSCIAAIQAPIIMMSQNRASKKDRLKADLDYQVNLKSELMLQELLVKLDELRVNELHVLMDKMDQQHTSFAKKLRQPSGVTASRKKRSSEKK